MTSLDLICESKLSIGLIGSLQFIGLAIGALAFVQCNDIYGRKPTLIATSIFTPLAVVYIVFFLGSLTEIYATILLLSLTYSTRGAATFILGNEFVTKRYSIYFAAGTFTFDGLFLIFTAVFFREFKSQNSYLAIIGVFVAISTLLVWAFCPETPKFLYEKERWTELEGCFRTIGKFNQAC